MEEVDIVCEIDLIPKSPLPSFPIDWDKMVTVDEKILSLTVVHLAKYCIETPITRFAL